MMGLELAKFSNITHYTQYLSDPAAANHSIVTIKHRHVSRGWRQLRLILDNTNNTNNINNGNVGTEHPQQSSQTVSKKARGNICQDCHSPARHTSHHPFSIVSDLLRLFLFNWLVFIVFSPLFTIITIRLFFFHSSKSPHAPSAIRPRHYP